MALNEGQTVGTVSVLDEDSARLYIRSMAVTPAAQGRRIGQKLIEEIERFALKQGFQKLYLYTTPFLHGAIGLYRKNGFEQRGDVGGFFGTPLIELEKDLS